MWKNLNSFKSSCYGISLFQHQRKRPVLKSGAYPTLEPSDITSYESPSKKIRTENELESTVDFGYDSDSIETSEIQDFDSIELSKPLRSVSSLKEEIVEKVEDFSMKYDLNQSENQTDDCYEWDASQIIQYSTPTKVSTSHPEMNSDPNVSISPCPGLDMSRETFSPFSGSSREIDESLSNFEVPLPDSSCDGGSHSEIDAMSEVSFDEDESKAIEHATPVQVIVKNISDHNHVYSSYSDLRENILARDLVVELPNSRWGIHRCYETQSLIFSYFEMVKNCNGVLVPYNYKKVLFC